MVLLWWHRCLRKVEPACKKTRGLRSHGTAGTGRPAARASAPRSGGIRPWAAGADASGVPRHAASGMQRSSARYMSARCQACRDAPRLRASLVLAAGAFGRAAGVPGGLLSPPDVPDRLPQPRCQATATLGHADLRAGVVRCDVEGLGAQRISAAVQAAAQGRGSAGQRGGGRREKQLGAG